MNRILAIEKWYQSMTTDTLRELIMTDIEAETKAHFSQTREMSRIKGDQMRALAHAVLDQKNDAAALAPRETSLESLEVQDQGKTLDFYLTYALLAHPEQILTSTFLDELNGDSSSGSFEDWSTIVPFGSTTTVNSTLFTTTLTNAEQQLDPKNSERKTKRTFGFCTFL